MTTIDPMRQAERANATREGTADPYCSRTISVLKDGEPYRLVDLIDSSDEAAIRRATAAVFMDDLRNDNDPKLRDHYTGEVYVP